MNCRFCKAELTNVFCDLGHQPPSNSFLTAEQLDQPEVTYPLRVFVCTSCWLVQVPEIAEAKEIFTDSYPYYSSQSPANVSHAKEFAGMMCERFGYNKDSTKIAEVGSNDGYLLREFEGKVFARIGYEPSSGPASKAIQDGIPTVLDFFNSASAKIARSVYGGYELICGINVLAHQPDINDFVEGLRISLAPGGVIVMEFPHLMRLVDGVQFDTIYHEHYSYFSLATICEIFEKHLLSVFDVDEIPEHGGSLRIYAEHSPSCRHSEKLRELLLREGAKGMFTPEYYAGFQGRVDKIRRDFIQFLCSHEVVAYGAAAKGNTFLNFVGVRSDQIQYVVDRSPHKIGKYLPGSHIPVVSEEELKRTRPAYILLTAWNLRDEIMEQLSYTRAWGCRFVTALPRLEVL